MVVITTIGQETTIVIDDNGSKSFDLPVFVWSSRNKEVRKLAMKPIIISVCIVFNFVAPVYADDFTNSVTCRKIVAEQWRENDDTGVKSHFNKSDSHCYALITHFKSSDDPYKYIEYLYDAVEKKEVAAINWGGTKKDIGHCPDKSGRVISSYDSANDYIENAMNK